MVVSLSGSQIVFLQVHGIIRRSSSFNTGRIEHLYADPKSHSGGCMYIKLY